MFSGSVAYLLIVIDAEAVLSLVLKVHQMIIQVQDLEEEEEEEEEELLLEVAEVAKMVEN